MAIANLYSKRQRLARQGTLDVLTYDIIPTPLRVQIVHILNDAFEEGSHRLSAHDYFDLIKDTVVREYGVFNLSDAPNSQIQIVRFIQHEQDIERVLDVVELSLQFIDDVLRDDIEEHEYRKLVPDEAINDLNTRFKEHAIGYSFESGQIIRVDSTYTHAEIVKPTLQLLSNPLFTGANEEYLKAHEHYRRGRNKECLTDCLKAFESTLKTIFTNKGWVFSPNDTSSALITHAINNQLVPSYLQTQLTSLKSLLVSGIPTLRNRLGGHGQGAIPTTVDDETARYALNLTGSNIIYLIELSAL